MESVTLTDTGPLVALVDTDDVHHEQAVKALKGLPKVPLLTTWPCLTEVMYLVYQAAGYDAQEELWEFVSEGILQIYLPLEEDWRRMQELMGVYHDAPMDFADASIVVAAETLDLHRVFTFDRHFYAYRTAEGGVLEVLP